MSTQRLVSAQSPGACDARLPPGRDSVPVTDRHDAGILVSGRTLRRIRAAAAGLAAAGRPAAV
ncbi:MAG TPA: hypothetical protein DEH11_08580 [Actinobacteria bacterium]|nr:hypothetical protein [Actinomycetota bacterium]